MSLSNACQSLNSAARPANGRLEPVSPAEALEELLAFAEQHELRTDHPWELAARVCRDLEAETGRVPVGGWAKLTGLAAGTGLFRAGSDAFEPLADRSMLLGPGDVRRKLVEAFTRRLIPPAAAAALYVALDVHPLWGLRLGREVGSTRVDLDGSLDALGSGGLEHTQALVFGTLSGLLVAMRGLDPGMLYPMDALGEVMWWSAKQARAIAPKSSPRVAVPVLVDRGERELRMLTTRLAIADVIDYVFAPAGAARRDDAGWVRFAPDALRDVVVGDLGPVAQFDRFAELCHVGAVVC